ncbi:hypothetical protein WMY93_015606 [Mugilogobius chulae]|uniref:UPAR/Ly6 domain-containing protein n=1 Tax=Mugilogobius chulae TaxID=88201 RepID=A0AAW0NQK7_9GOBI
MSRTILLLLAVTLCFTAVQALQCYSCKWGVWNLCLTSEKTCAPGEHCFSGKGEAVKFIDIKSKGCLPAAECNKTTSTNFPTDSSTVYSVVKTCCNFNLCNSATTSLPGVLQLALASVAAVLGANALV